MLVNILKINALERLTVQRIGRAYRRLGRSRGAQLGRDKTGRKREEKMAKSKERDCQYRKKYRLGKAEMPVQCGQICRSKGLLSIDRSVVAALLGTRPRPQPRSFTNDLATATLHGVDTIQPSQLVGPSCAERPKTLAPKHRSALSLPPNTAAQAISLHFRTGF